MSEVGMIERLGVSSAQGSKKAGRRQARTEPSQVPHLVLGMLSLHLIHSRCCSATVQGFVPILQVEMLTQRGQGHTEHWGRIWGHTCPPPKHTFLSQLL